MDLSQPIFLGMDLPALPSNPVMLVMFAFAIWYGASRVGEGISAAEAARRNG